MKSKSQFTWLLLFITIAAFLTSCKKHPGSSTQCMITDIRKNDSFNSEWQLTYDSSKRLSMIYDIKSGEKQMFTYASNLMIRNKISDSGMLFETDSIFLNTGGLVSSITYFNPTSGRVDQYDSMYYDSHNELVRLTHRSTRPGYTLEEDYDWNNGDAVSYNFGGSTGTYTYYTDKQAAQGDLNEISDLLIYGVVTKHCKHLFEGNKNQTVSYSFDTDGKITAALGSRSGSTTVEQIYSYTYTCY